MVIFTPHTGCFNFGLKIFRHEISSLNFYLDKNKLASNFKGQEGSKVDFKGQEGSEIDLPLFFVVSDRDEFLLPGTFFE